MDKVTAVTEAHALVDSSQVLDTLLVSNEPTEEDVQQEKLKNDIDSLHANGIRFFNKT